MFKVKCILIRESLVSVVPVTARAKDPHQMLQYSSLSLYSLLVDSQHLHANTEKNAVNVKQFAYVCQCGPYQNKNLFLSNELIKVELPL